MNGRQEGGQAARTYHLASGHTVEEVKARRDLDWSRQPAVFKGYPAAPLLELPPPEREPTGQGMLDLAGLGRLLYFSAGLTRAKVYPGGCQYLRAAPSAGALYPIEVYAGCGTGAVTGLGTGLYHYAPASNGLGRIGDGDSLERLLAAAGRAGAAGLVIALSAVFHRSAWKYLERAYRYVLLDAGHIWGNLAEAARREDLTLTPWGDFADAEANAGLGLDGKEEAVLLLAGVGAKREPQFRFQPAKAPVGCSGGLIQFIHEASSLVRGDGEGEGEPVGLPPLADAAIMNYPFMATVRRRSSARAFTGEGIPEDDLGLCLRVARPTVPLSLYTVVNRVEGVTPGLYRVSAQGLTLLRPGDHRNNLGSLCLWQDLVTKAAAILVYTSRFPSDRSYRYAHLQAGYLSEQVYLAATAAGVGVSGIGAFFDAELGEILGVEEDEWPIYVTVVGKPKQPPTRQIG